MSKYRELTFEILGTVDVSDTDEALEYIAGVLRRVEHETLSRAALAALSHKSPPTGEECPGCEAVENIRKLAMPGVEK